MDSDDRSKNCCSKQVMVTDIGTGENACGSCGQVFGMESNGQLGSSVMREDDDLNLSQNYPLDPFSKKSTTIGVRNNDFSGKPLSAEIAYLFRRLRIWDGRIDRTKRSIAPAIGKIESVMKDMGMGDDVVLETKRFFKKYTDANFTAGRSIDESVAGVVYGVLKKYGSGRIREVAKELNVKPDKVMASYRIFFENFEDEINNGRVAGEQADDTRSDITRDLYSSLSLIMEKFDAPDGVKLKIQRYAKNVFDLPKIERYIAGKSRFAIAASAIYMAAESDPEIMQYTTQKKLSVASGISEVTIRNNKRKMIDEVCGPSYAK